MDLRIKRYINKVMAFLSNQTVVANQSKTESINSSTNDLTKDELAMMLNILKEVTLKGHQVEIFYNLIVKIQNQFLEKSK